MGDLEALSSFSWTYVPRVFAVKPEAWPHQNVRKMVASTSAVKEVFPIFELIFVRESTH